MRDTGKSSRFAIFAAVWAASALTLALAAPAQAIPFHARAKSLDVTGLNHACGTAVDSKGDLYLSSAGESKVNVYNPAHALLTSISDAHEPCGLAVTTTGVVYVSEKAAGEVVQFKPNAYPFSGTPTYGSREVVDASGKAKGIAVDPFDDALYVAEGDHVSAYVHEMQTLQLENEVTGGTFKLIFEGKETGPLSSKATGKQVQEALEALTTIGAGNVEVAEYPSSSSWAVFFTGKFAYTDVPAIGRDYSLLTGTNPRLGDIETAKGWSGTIGEGALTEATGVAAYTYRLPGAEKNYRYLWAADPNGLLPDRLELLTGQSVTALKPRRELTGSTTPAGSFGFGTKGAYLAADPGNRDGKGKCVVVGEQACTAGHLLLYDATHKALDEFDASGEYLDQTHDAAFADAEPTAVAIDRSGGANDGTVYVTAGAGAGAKVLAFGRLKAPSRKVMKKPSEEAGGLSQEVAAATSVAVDARGYLYVAQASLIHVYKPNGTEVKTEANKVLLEDKKAGKGAKPYDLAVDSTGKVYVLDENGGAAGEEEVTYYTPSKYPPEPSTTYTRHEPPVVTPPKFSAKGSMQAIAINPGPSSGKDRLFVTNIPETQEYDSAANGSGLLNKEFAAGLNLGNRQSLAVNGASGNVWFGGNPKLVSQVDPSGKEIISQLENTGASNGKIGLNPIVALDQSNGHLITFDGATSSAREYDAAGSFVAQFGTFTEGLVKSYDVAVDDACAIHEPPLTGKACEEFDPANGTAFVVFGDTSATHPPYNGVNAFGSLTYSTPAKHKLTVERTGTGSGTVTSSPAGISCGATCSAEFDETEVVTLTAKANAGSELVKWTGCEAETVSPTEGTCEVTMSEDHVVKAEFEKGVTPEYPLTVKKTGAGEATLISTPEGIDCDPGCEEETAKFPADTEVTLKASAEAGSELLGWGVGDCEAKTVSVHEGTCTLTIDEAKEVVLEAGEEHPLLTVLEKGGGSGTVASEDGFIGCAPTCSHKYDLGDEVILNAQAAKGSKFEAWSGCKSEPEPQPGEVQCEVKMEEPQQVTVTFDALPQAIAKHALPILYDEATLHGEVDPGGLPTEYRFEYLTEKEYEDNGETFEGAQKTPKGELAPAKGLVAVGAPLFGLEEGTVYHFRLRTMNSVGPAEDEGPPFETLQRGVSSPCPNAPYRFGPSANLPDCRAYELVTPAQTNGLSPYAATEGNSASSSFSNWLTPQGGEAAGRRLTYFTDGTLPGFEGDGLLDGYRAERGSGDHPAAGWQSTLFAPSYKEAAGRPANPLGVASDQLYSIWELTSKSTTFPETLTAGIYLRTPIGFEALGDSEALSQYASPGGAHVIFTSRAHLEPGAPPAPTQAVYDHPAGAASTTVVSSPPPAASPALKAVFESDDASFAGASEDGTVVAFNVNGILYLHREGKTVAIAPGTYAGVSEDDRYIFYTLGASGSPGSLFRFDTQSEEATEITKTGIFALVSPDGSHAFFSSTEALTGAEENENLEVAEAGDRNLYAWDGSGVRFVGRLATADFKEGTSAENNITGGFGGNHEMNLAAWTRAIATVHAPPLGPSGRAYAPTRSTQSGHIFVFQSHARLTAYDNEGVGEIYRFDPSAPEGERLLCVSCNPTDAPPSADDALLEDLRITGGSPVNSRTMIANVSGDGEKVLFQSFDQLLPEDVNGAEDVYEWEADGTGGCARLGGCLSLISTGQGETPSFLYAMSADGSDVFIQTREKLVGSDVTGSPSIYDARVGGGIPEPAEPAPCQGDACQGQGSESPVLPSPLTGGPGEEPQAEVGTTPRKPCAKGRHRVKGRCVPVKHRHRKHNRRTHANNGGNR